MSAKSYIGRIFRDHYASLPVDWQVVSHLVPLVAVAPVALGFRMTENQLAAFITAVSIYSALLFGILVPAGDQANRLSNEIKGIQDSDSTAEKLKLARLKIHRDVARETLANVAFSIITSLVTVLALVITFCLRPKEGVPAPTYYVAALGVSLYLCTFLLLLLLIIVRTVYGSWMSESE